MDGKAVIPVHKWTNGGERVRILRCCNANGTSYGGFVWPKSGPVIPNKWSREANCKSGGLFGWAWGLCFGAGKEPNYQGVWIVFEAHPDDVILLEDGKVKAVPNPELNRTPGVIYYGTYAKANQLILEGQIAWVEHTAKGAASATGDRGAASATGYRGAASATGSSGAASATGSSGAAVCTQYGSVQASATGIAVSTADECWWLVIEGAVFVQRWENGHRLVTAEMIGAKTGDRVRFVKGEVVEHLKAVSGRV